LSVAHHDVAERYAEQLRLLPVRSAAFHWDRVVEGMAAKPVYPRLGGHSSTPEAWWLTATSMDPQSTPAPTVWKYTPT
jgi:hypothetical protein